MGEFDLCLMLAVLGCCLVGHLLVLFLFFSSPFPFFLTFHRFLSMLLSLLKKRVVDPFHFLFVQNKCVDHTHKQIKIRHETTRDDNLIIYTNINLFYEHKY